MTATDAADTTGGPPPGRDAERPRWGVLDVVAAFLVAQIASGIGLAVFSSAKGVPIEDLTEEALSLGEIALLQLPLWLGLLVVPLVATRVRGNGAVHDLGLWTRWSDAPVGLLIGVACQLVLVPLVTWPLLELTNSSSDDVSERAEILADKAAGPGVLLLFLVLAVGAPVAEEVFYRGLLQRTMARKVPIWPTMVIVALLFAATHGLGEVERLRFPALAIFGLVLSYLAHRTGRLGTSIWAHVGFNATTVVLLSVAG
ncbi:MAG: CPBP family intramembrane glutamic endopeptidase [Acidimicrobiales bacterium]|nr:CPBP family intramembrane glutamic endopeptidase [Acidimicrobiales bacterium]